MVAAVYDNLADEKSRLGLRRADSFLRDEDVKLVSRCSLQEARIAGPSKKIAMALLDDPNVPEIFRALVHTLADLFRDQNTTGLTVSHLKVRHLLNSRADGEQKIVALLLSSRTLHISTK